jgi:hypothetical protein
MRSRVGPGLRRSFEAVARGGPLGGPPCSRPTRSPNGLALSRRSASGFAPAGLPFRSRTSGGFRDSATRDGRGCVAGETGTPLAARSGRVAARGWIGGQPVGARRSRPQGAHYGASGARSHVWRAVSSETTAVGTRWVGAVQRRGQG